MSRAMVVLLSGGLDSTAALFWARKVRGMEVAMRALFVDYGQPHLAAERPRAEAAARAAGVELEHASISLPWYRAGDVVIGRNLVLLHLAAALGVGPMGATEVEVVIGSCAADQEGFPDCRPVFLAEAGKALSLGMGATIQPVAPWAAWSKAQIIQIADAGGYGEHVRASWSCYRGGAVACGECNACRFRAAGFAKAGGIDPATVPR